MQQTTVHRGSDRHSSLVRRNTSRVPGITRNSGWQDVNADIVRTRNAQLHTASGEDELRASVR
jgi:hypothetical protein